MKPRTFEEVWSVPGPPKSTVQTQTRDPVLLYGPHGEPLEVRRPIGFNPPRKKGRRRAP